MDNINIQKRGNMIINKHSQVTIFIILAIVLVAVLIIIFYPRISKVYFAPKSPSNFIQDCMKPYIDETIAILMKQGGSLNPANILLYQDNKIEYLCYTSEYYKTCIMQQAMLKQHFEEELVSGLTGKAEQCIKLLAEDYQSRGYEAVTRKSNLSASIIPGSVRLELNPALTLKKETSQSYDKFEVIKSSQIYDLLMIAESILNWEARYGDSVPESYMQYYPDLKVEKLKQSDGSKIYILTNRITNERFTFASRSLSWPAGYGVGE